MKKNIKIGIITIISIVIIVFLFWRPVKEHLENQKEAANCQLGCAVTVADLTKVQVDIEANKKRMEEIRKECKTDLQNFRTEITKSTQIL